MKIHLMGEGVREVVVIQEILADPPSDLEGDANGDGVRHRNQDEFVELLNIGFKPVRLDGWQLSDAGTAPRSRFTFPENTLLEPGGRTVLFGGGSPTGFSELVFVDDGTIGGGLNNRGDAVFLIDPRCRIPWRAPFTVPRRTGTNRWCVTRKAGVHSYVIVCFRESVRCFHRAARARSFSRQKPNSLEMKL